MVNFLVRIRPELVLVYEYIIAFIGALITYSWSLTQVAATFSVGVTAMWFGFNAYIFMLMILAMYATNPIDRFWSITYMFSYGILGGLMWNGFQNLVFSHQTSGLYDILIFGGAFIASLVVRYRNRTQRP